MTDLIVNAVKAFPRIETKFYMDVEGEVILLKPAIPKDIVDRCRLQIQEMLEEQRIGPELRMQDFDDYMSLMNGKV
jgi:dynein heavy chain, axonemal